MKRIILLVILIVMTVSCVKTESAPKDPAKDLFEPSNRESKDNNEFTEYFDTLSYIYSNYKFNIAVKVPKSWKYDQGVTEHMIFRSFDKDSGYSFNINVIETKYNIEQIFWKEYENNRDLIDEQLKKVIEHQLNVPVDVELSDVTYIRNYKSLKKKYNYVLRDQDYEFDMVCLVFQIPKGNFTYTISLTLPKQFYDERPNYFNGFFSNIYWLTDKDKVKRSILEIK